MNKDEMIEEMIEEMAKEISDLEDEVCDIECKLKVPCGDCEFCTKEKGNIGCIEYAIAENLYNAGYRKVGEDEIVIKTSETKCPTDEKAIAFFVEHNAKVRKEFEREILKRFDISKLFYILYLVNKDYEDKNNKINEPKSEMPQIYPHNDLKKTKDLIIDIQGLIMMIAGKRAITTYSRGKSND